MKATRNILAMLAMSALAAICGFAQTSEKPTKNPKYDAAFARKVGADKMGMRSYVLAILKTGPKDAEIKGDERKKMFEGHFANISRMAAEGKLAIAGPFGKNDKTFRGLYIFTVATVDEAAALVNTDPVIKSGMMIAELVPWYGSAALMEVNRLHDMLSEDNPQQ
ncbi:MAG: YciI family protein [Pyrinomonadaceae bacterium]